MRLASLLLVLLLVPGAWSAEPEAGFEPLLDGRSLEGWEGRADVFRVQNGAIVAGSLERRIPRNEFLATRKEYGDFELRLEARLRGPGRNAGVQFRSRRIPDHHEVIGYQCDMGQAGEKNIWGSLYDESRRRKFLAEAADPEKLAEAFRADAWNKLVIRCQGARVQIWVNDVQTVDYTEQDDQIARRGIIALQIHGGQPAEASYRNIRLRELSANDTGP